MNTDSYTFAKSSAPQGVDLYTPFQDKQWNYVNDINSGVYQNNGLTQVQFDLTSIYNSGAFTDTADLFLTIPITMTAACLTAAGATIAPVGAAAGPPVVVTTNPLSNLLTMKSNFQHLIHQIDVTVAGKTVSDQQPFISLYQNFKLLSSMSVNDLKQFGSSFGLGEELDSEKATVYSPVAAAYTPQLGVGLCNNRPFVSTTITGSDTQGILGASQNTGAINKSLARRCTRVVDTTLLPAASFNKIYGNTPTANGNFLMSSNQLANEFKPYYTIIGNIHTWYDVAVIPLKYIVDCIDKMGLVRKLDMILRFYVNTGTLSLAVANPGATTLQYGAFSNSTFSNTCPFTVNHLPATETTGGLPSTTATAGIAAGLFVGRAPSTSIPFGGASVNLGLNAVNHFMPACRAYYSLIKMEPQKAISYVDANREKRVVYENVIFNQYTNIPSGGSFSQLVSSGIKHSIGLCIIPLIGSQTVPSTGGGTLGFEQYQSPYDATMLSPLSLTNLQVSLGGVQQLNSTLFYTYESFLEQVALAETLTGSDLGMSVGLINQSFWESNRVYWVDLARGRDADKASMRNLSISFNNNTNASITLMVYTVYLDSLTLDVETGIIRR